MGFSIGVNTLKEEISAEEVFAISGILTKIKFHEKFHGSIRRANIDIIDSIKDFN